MPDFLYIRGTPGSGKHTVAKILERDLGWTLFWSHDLDAICRIVGSRAGDCSLARVMDEVTTPIIRHLLEQGKNVIYVRPSRDEETVVQVRNTVQEFDDYRFHLVHLHAQYETLCKRVQSREPSDFRISSVQALKEYVDARPMAIFGDAKWIDTSTYHPRDVADFVTGYVVKRFGVVTSCA